MQHAEPAGQAAEKKPVWNSLEVAKLVVSLVMPVAVFWFGLELKARDEESARRETDAKAALARDFKQKDDELAGAIRTADLARAKQIRDADKRWAEQVQRLEDERTRYQEGAEDRRSALQRTFERNRQREVDGRQVYESRLAALREINRLIFARQVELDGYAVAILPQLGNDPRAISARSANIGLTKENYSKRAASWSVDVLTSLEGYRSSLSDDQFQRLQGLTSAQLPSLYRDAFRCVEAKENGDAQALARCGKVETRVRLVWACNSKLISLLGRAAMPAAERPGFDADLKDGCFEYRE